MKQLYTPILTTFCFIFTTALLAQPCYSYGCVIAKVEHLLQKETKDYKTILDNLDSAEGYTDYKPEKIRALRRRVFEAIENEKKKAVDATNEAVKQKQEADKQTQIAETEKDNAKKALTQADSARIISEIQKKEAQTQTQIAETEKDNAKKAQTQTQAVLNKIYFYDNKFGLAYDKNSYRYAI